MLDPHDAPPGYVAIEHLGPDACDHCALRYGSLKCINAPDCSGIYRADGCPVRYMKVEQPEAKG